MRVIAVLTVLLLCSCPTTRSNLKEFSEAQGIARELTVAIQTAGHVLW